MRRLLMPWWLVACVTVDAPDPRDDRDDTPPDDPVDDPVPDDPPDEPPALPSYAPLSAVELLVRASLDLRGVRPSLAELEAVEDDPAAVDDLIEGFLEDERFGRRVADVFEETFQTLDERPSIKWDYWLEDHSTADLARSVGGEPGWMLAHIADEDLSYAEMVTGDWTMANEVLADIWPVTWPEGAEGWQRVQYTDGRPAAGALATNGLWWQYGTMVANENRGRANQFSRIFLCFDYLDLEIDFTGVQVLNSEEALGEAVRTDPNCSVCHDSLDRLASHFFGFWYFGAREGLPGDVDVYHPEREWVWADIDGLPPSYLGEPTGGLVGLGPEVAADPRFARCFVERSWEGLMRRAPTPAEKQVLIADHLDTFQESDLVVRDLWAEIVASEAYRDGAVAPRLISGLTLGNVIEDLTGYRWSIDDWDMMIAPYQGFSALVGFVDGAFRTSKLEEPGPTLLLTQQRLAEDAAAHVVRRDLVRDEGEDARLLDIVPRAADGDPTEQQVVDQIVSLHARILTRRVAPSDPDVTELVDLWNTLAAERTGAEAWAAVVTVLLRDPALLWH